MSDERLCDALGCLQPATVMLAIRFGQHLGLGYWSCELHQADAFWQVTKLGLQQEESCVIVLLTPDQVEAEWSSRA